MFWLTLIIQIIIGVVITIIFILALEFIATIFIDAGKLKVGIFISNLTNLLTKSGYIILGEGYYFKGEFSTAADFLLFAAESDIFYRPVALYYLAKCNSCLEEVFDYSTELILPHEFSSILSSINTPQSHLSLSHNKKDFNKYLTISKDDLSQGRLYMALALTYFNKGVQEQKALELAQIAVRYVSNLKTYGKIPIYIDYAEILLYFNQPDKAMETLNEISEMINQMNDFQKIFAGYCHLSHYYLIKGKIYRQLTRQEKANECIQKTIQFSPESYFAGAAKTLLKG